MVASEVWSRFGDVPNYVEPFFGSGAVLLGRPTEAKTETVNDINAYLTNFWRSVQNDPACVAYWCDKPVQEIELHSVHRWLQTMGRDIVEKLRDDPDFYDPKVAGWWVWGLCCWIGSGWCECNKKQKPVLTVEKEINTVTRRTMPKLSSSDGIVGLTKGVPRDDRAGESTPAHCLEEWFVRLQERLRYTRVCCGDYTRVLGDSSTVRHGVTGVFLDPPYENYESLYGSKSVSGSVREWALANGDNPLFRIALCGYEGEHELPSSWECLEWKANGGMGNQKKDKSNQNCRKERIWFSPHCLKKRQPTLFDEEVEE